MESRFKIAGHPFHPMLIVFPLGLLATAVVFDIVGLVSGDTSWFNISFWMISAGIIGGLLAAVPGLVDWWAIPRNTRAKAIGLWHGIGAMWWSLCCSSSVGSCGAGTAMCRATVRSYCRF